MPQHPPLNARPLATPLEDRLEVLERDVAHLRRRERRWRLVAGASAVVAAVLWLSGASPADAGRAPKQLVVANADGTRTAELDPDGLVFTADGKPRMKVEIGPTWDYLTMYSPSGGVTWSVASEDDGTSMKIFSREEKLRAEVAEQLIDSGAGVRLYDQNGNPRATFYADKRGGESGVELTDANRQPRIDIYAEPDGVTMLRASTSAADASAELSILPESDAESRYTGAVPEAQPGEPFVPMLYMLDRSGVNTLVTPVTPTK